ncbi:hypothetical protein [Devosia aquimaris]|uniref:hypothetical protein n=1 Tax=Devosia aquimaris TaxID=2866214 RepID=UPI001CD0D6CB|nr:hypothetical protein [Devosia sp. CJK-A8-3]
MRLIQSHPIAPEGDRSGHTCIGLIDVELTPDVRVYKLRVLRMRDGRYRVQAPYAGKHLAASFSPDLAEKLTAMAIEALQVAA